MIDKKQGYVCISVSKIKHLFSLLLPAQIPHRLYASKSQGFTEQLAVTGGKKPASGIPTAVSKRLKHNPFSKLPQNI